MFHWKNTSCDLFKPYIRLVFKLKTQSLKWQTLLDNWYSSNLKTTKSEHTDEDKIAGGTLLHGRDPLDRDVFPRPLQQQPVRAEPVKQC